MTTPGMTELKSLREELGETFARTDLVVESAVNPQVSTTTWEGMLRDLIVDLMATSARMLTFAAPFLPDKPGEGGKG